MYGGRFNHLEASQLRVIRAKHGTLDINIRLHSIQKKKKKGKVRKVRTTVNGELSSLQFRKWIKKGLVLGGGGGDVRMHELKRKHANALEQKPGRVATDRGTHMVWEKILGGPALKRGESDSKGKSRKKDRTSERMEKTVKVQGWKKHE